MKIIPDSPPAKLPHVVFVTSHPIQYQVPVFRCLAQHSDIRFTVLFAQIPDAASQGAGFGVAFAWDIPLLDGYNYRVLRNVARTPSVTKFSGCDTPEIRAVLHDLGADIVIINGWVVKTCLQTLWACRRLKIPCLVRGEANNLRYRSWWKRMLQRILVRQFDGVLAIGKANRKFYRSHQVPDSRIYEAPYCVENERFSKAAALAASNRNELRKRWGIAEASVCYLFCGKLETKKHPVELLRSFQSVISAGSCAHLLIVGDGELKAECKSFAQQNGLPVTFTGFLNQTHIIDAYVAADLLVLPSDVGETWGLVANEAMACGKPVIVSDQVGCAEDLIVTGQTGWIFRFGDFRNLSQVMTEIAANPGVLGPMQSFCQWKIAEYSPQVACQGIIEAARALIHSRTNM